MDRFQLLTSFGVQTSSGHKISVRAAGRPDRQVDQPAAAQRAGRPEWIVGALQHTDRSTEVVQGLRIPSEGPQHKAAPMQHLSRQYACGQLDSTLKCSESVRRPACVNERYPQGPEHISFALR